MLAGLPVADHAVDDLAAIVPSTGADDLADRLERALDQVPPDDRTPSRRLFPGLNEGTMRDAIGRAAAAFGTPAGCPPASARSGWGTRKRR